MPVARGDITHVSFRLRKKTPCSKSHDSFEIVAQKCLSQSTKTDEGRSLREFFEAKEINDMMAFGTGRGC